METVGMEEVGTITSEGEGGFSWSLGETRLSRRDWFDLWSPEFTFKDAGYVIELAMIKQSSLIQTTLYRTHYARLANLSIECEWRAENERVSQLRSVTMPDETYHRVICATSIREFLPKRKGGTTYREHLVLSFRLREEPPGGRRGAGAEVAEETNKSLDKDSEYESTNSESEEESPSDDVIQQAEPTITGPVGFKTNRFHDGKFGMYEGAGAEVAEETNKALEKDSGNESAGAEVAEESNKALDKDSEYENLKKLQEDVEKLFLSEKDSDVILKVQDKKFPAHRNVLRARSPVFEAMFTHDMEENRSGDVAIEDGDPETFPVFLRYLYTGSTEHVTLQNVCQLFIASDKYEVLLLKSKCAEFMKSHFSIESFCDFITLALKHTEEELLRSATEFFCANTVEIAKTVKWQVFLRENSTVGNELFLKAWQKGKKCLNCSKNIL